MSTRQPTESCLVDFWSQFSQRELLVIMQVRVIRTVICSAGVILLITGVAKLVSSFGNARILQYPDPILCISFRQVLLIVGTIELIIALACFYGKQTGLQAALIAWLATNFLVYRLGLTWVDYQKPCSCLGNLTEALHIPPQTANSLMRIILGYLLMSSYSTLFWLWRKHKKGTAPASA